MSQIIAAYLLTNNNHTTLYVGSSRDLVSRTRKHKTKYYKNSFSARYNIDKLVYYEQFDRLWQAREREYQIKAGSRQKKLDLINAMNPEWRDLYDDLQQN